LRKGEKNFGEKTLYSFERGDELQRGNRQRKGAFVAGVEPPMGKRLLHNVRDAKFDQRGVFRKSSLRKVYKTTYV